MPIKPLFLKPRTLIPTLISSTAGRTFLISLAAWLLAFFYCRHRFWRDPHSAFFQSEHVYEWKYTAYRRSQGLSFLDGFEKQNAPGDKASDNPEICAAFVTVKREGEQYFDASLGSLLEGLTPAEREKLHLNVVFADPDPEIHPSWGKEWLGKGVDWWGGYNVSKETHDQLREWMESKNWPLKSRFDYLYALNICYETNTPYILMFEDDIIFADSWLAQTLFSLQTIESQTTHQHWTNFLFLRLFYTETQLGWDSTVDFWYRRLDLLLFLSATSSFLLLHFLRGSIPSIRRVCDIWSSLIISLLTIPAFIILAFMIGKYSLFPLRGVVDLGPKGCCSQALVFPRDRIPALVEWINQRPVMNMDTTLDAYAVENGMERLAIGRQVVQHVGLTSSRGGRMEDARSGRAFWFEEYDPDVLGREHTELIRELGLG